MHSCFIGQGLGGKSKGTLCLIWLLDLTVHFKYTSYYHGKNGNLLFPFWTRIHEAVCGRAAVCPLGTGMMLTGDRDGTFEVWVKREGLAGFPPGEQSSSELSFCSSCCLLPADLGSYVLLSTVCLSSPPIGEVLWLPLHRAWRDWEPQSCEWAPAPAVFFWLCCYQTARATPSSGSCPEVLPEFFPETSFFCWISTCLQLQPWDHTGLLLVKGYLCDLGELWAVCNLQGLAHRK